METSSWYIENNEAERLIKTKESTLIVDLRTWPKDFIEEIWEIIEKLS